MRNTDHPNRLDAPAVRLTSRAKRNAIDINALERRIDLIERRLDDASQRHVADRREGIMVPCGGAKVTKSNPLGLRRGHHRSPDAARAFYRGNYERAARLGVGRVVWHMLAGWEQEHTMAGAAAVLGAMGDRADVWVEETSRFLEAHPRASVGVYLSAHVPRSWRSVRADDILPWEAYDHANQSHRRMMIQNIIRPLVDAGVTEVWFDHASPAEFRPGVLDLCDHLRDRLGVHCVIEALPLDARGGLDALRRAGAGAQHRFIAIRDPDGRWTWPAEAEVNVLLSRHSGAPMPNDSIVDDYRRRGGVVWSMHESFDRLLAPAEVAQASRL